MLNILLLYKWLNIQRRNELWVIVVDAIVQIAVDVTIEIIVALITVADLIMDLMEDLILCFGYLSYFSYKFY